ncbi:MAG: AAA family ATPase [Clostridia bacterium]|nr:AAA family ATPase [Clostridia bacterium]
MYIKQLNIKSFGTLTDRVIELDRGLNVISGANECGKSTVAAFIKFIFYGLSGKATGGDGISEKEHYVNWENGLAAGFLVAECRDGEYTVERRLYRTSEGGRDIYREGVKIVNRTTGEAVKTSKSPGEYFFGFPEKVYLQSAFVKGAENAKIDGGGLKVALENLMSSGDEEINTKRALEKLDAARKLLRYKKGSGGRIEELEAEKEKLRGVLKDAQSSSQKIVDLEGTLADVVAKRAKREEEAKELSALCKAYEALRIGAKVKDIDRCEAEVKSVSEELSALNPAADDELVAKIDLCESRVRETERDIATLSRKKAELEEKLAGRDDTEPETLEGVGATTKKMKRGVAFCLSAACTLAILGLMGIFCAVIPALRTRISEAGYLGVVIILTVVFFLLAAAGFVGYRIYSATYKRFLEGWGADDDESLDAAVMAKYDSYKYTVKLKENISRIDSITEEAITKHDAEIDRGISYGARVGVKESDNVFEVLAEARRIAKESSEKRRELTARLEGAKGRLSAILEDVGEEERSDEAAAEREALSAGREKALTMTKDEYNRTLRERDFAESSAAAFRERESSIEKELAALNAAGKTPSEVAGRISVIEEEIDTLESKHSALVMALEALEAAGEKMRGDVMPRVAEDAAAILDKVTGGKYGTLSSGEDFNLTVKAGGERRTVDFLSEGTKDASYISIRTSLVKVMYSEEVPTMIFDECFARLDKDRAGQMVEILSSEGMPQSILLTCRPEFIEYESAKITEL